MAYNCSCLGCPYIIPGNGPCKLGGTGWKENPCPKESEEDVNLTFGKIIWQVLADFFRVFFY